MDYRALFINENQTILDAMRLLDKTGRRLLLVVEGDVLRGVVSDGDIRRHILSNGDLSEPIALIMTIEPKTLAINNLSKLEKVFNESQLQAIPIVDDDMKVVDVKFIDDVYKSSEKKVQKVNVPVVIMAGGHGTRLYPYTKILPKPLIPIGDVPIVERIIDRFAHFGCKEFYLTVNYKKNMIKAYFNELNPTYKVDYVDEDKPLGTAGSLSLLKTKLSGTFVLSNCDILVDIDLKEVLAYHHERANKITMVVSLQNHVIPYGVVTLDQEEKVSEIVEKPTYNMLVNTGVYVIEASVLDAIPQNTFIHITDVIDRLIKAGDKVGAYPISDNAWLDMGQFSELERMYDKLDLD